MHLKKPHLIKHKQRFSRKRFTNTNKRRRHFSTKNKNNKTKRKHHFLSVALFDDSKNDSKNVDKKVDGKNDGNIITGLRDFLKKI
jgi:hypothetical protein